MYFIFRVTLKEILGRTFILARAEDVKKVPENELPEKLKSCGKVIRTPEEFDAKEFLKVFKEYYERQKETLEILPEPYKYGANITLEGGNLNG